MEHLNIFRNKGINVKSLIHDIIEFINKTKPEEEEILKEKGILITYKTKPELLKVDQKVLDLLESYDPETKEKMLELFKKPNIHGPCSFDTIYGKFEFRLDGGLTVSCIKKEPVIKIIEDLPISLKNKTKEEIELEIKEKVQKISEIYPSSTFKNKHMHKHPDEHYNNCILSFTNHEQSVYDFHSLRNLFNVTKDIVFQDKPFDNVINFFETEYIKDNENEQKLKLSFNQVYNILKEKKHNKLEPFYFNDSDYKVYYDENDSYKMIANKSCGSFYITIIDKKSEQIKIWEAANIYSEKYWDEIKKSKRETFFATDILEMLSNHYENESYPFEMLGKTYKKSEDFLIKNFDHDNFILYDSQFGFKKDKAYLINYLLSDINMAQKSLCKEYNVSIAEDRANNIDPDSPEYFIRKMLHSKNKNFKNRTEVLFYALWLNGQAHSWNNTGGLTHEDSLLKNYPKHINEDKKGDLSIVIGASKEYSNIFKVKDKSPEWNSVAIELMESIRNYIDKEDNKNDFAYDDVKKSYLQCQKYLGIKTKTTKKPKLK